MKLDEKMNSIKVKIADIREHYGNEETEIDLYLNDIEVGISLLGTSAKSIVSDKISNIKMLSAVQCLGIQLPIHCLDSLFENFTFALKSLSDGEFFNSLESWIDSFSMPSGVNEALVKLKEYKDLIQEKIANLELLNKVFDEYEYLQGKMQMVLGSVGSLVGCIDRSAGTDLTRHLNSVTNPLSELNTDFKASIDAVKSSKEHFTNPTDILNDSKSRITANLDLDGLAEGTANDFTTRLNSLLG